VFVIQSKLTVSLFTVLHKTLSHTMIDKVKNLVVSFCTTLVII